MQKFLSDIRCFPCYRGGYRRSLQPDLAARTCENFRPVFSDYPVHGIAPPAPSREEGIACEVICPPLADSRSPVSHTPQPVKPRTAWVTGACCASPQGWVWAEAAVGTNGALLLWGAVVQKILGELLHQWG